MTLRLEASGFGLRGQEKEQGSNTFRSGFSELTLYHAVSVYSPWVLRCRRFLQGGLLVELV